MTQQERVQERHKAAVLRDAAAETAELLINATEWQVAHPQATLEEIEVEILQLRQEFGKRLGQVLLKHREATSPVPGPQCPTCGQEMRYKGEKARGVPSTIGDLHLERGYYHCPDCKAGVFPPR